MRLFLSQGEYSSGPSVKTTLQHVGLSVTTVKPSRAGILLCPVYLKTKMEIVLETCSFW